MKGSKKKAFTLIELMLAVAFIGTLLLSVAMLAMQLVNMYTKGVAMRSINAIGGDIADDLKQTITSSTKWSESIDPVDAGKGYNKEAVDNAKAKYYAYDKKGYGIFCTNSYTYIFNYQSAMLKYRETGNTNSTDYLLIKTSDSDVRPYGLARVKDSAAVLCQSAKASGGSGAFFTPQVTIGSETTTYDGVESSNTIKVDPKDLTVLLDGNDSNDGSDLELYDFSIMHATKNNLTGQALFDVGFVLGTMRGGINVMSSSNYCSQKAEGASEAAQNMANVGMSYCAVNRFEVTVRQTGNAGI
jgi:type II secretory pathway pseudopilin PulG